MHDVPSVGSAFAGITPAKHLSLQIENITNVFAFADELEEALEVSLGYQLLLVLLGRRIRFAWW